VVEPGDPVALAAALDHLLRHPSEARRLGRQAAHRAADLYDVSRMVAHYARIYENLLPARSYPSRHGDLAPSQA
jgi:glycosyltransferase involved in cell wall biosynthesis